MKCLVKNKLSERTLNTIQRRRQWRRAKHPVLEHVTNQFFDGVYYLMKKYPHKFRQRGLEAEKFIGHKAKCDPNCLGYVELYGNDFEWKKMRDGAAKFVCLVEPTNTIFKSSSRPSSKSSDQRTGHQRTT